VGVFVKASRFERVVLHRYIKTWCLVDTYSVQVYVNVNYILR